MNEITFSVERIANDK